MFGDNRRVPVRAREVEFMKQRLQGELVQSLEVVQTIEALERLRRHMDGAERRTKRAAVAGR